MAKKIWTTEIEPRVGELIRFLQEEKGLRVKDLAQKADVGAKTIQRIRNLKKKQAFHTSDLQRLAQALETNLDELLYDHFFDWLSEEDDYVSVNLMFECVKNMELTPLFRIYDSTWLRHQLVNNLDEVQNLIASGIQYEGVEGLISVNEVGQGAPIFQIFEDLPGGMSNYFLSTEDVATSTTVSSTFLGWAFPNDSPLSWRSLVRLEHLRLFRPDAQVKDNIYTTGHDFINQEGELELSEIDLAVNYGFHPVRNPDREFWVFDRIFFSPIFRCGNSFSMCWSLLSTAESYQLEMRFNQGKWRTIYHDSENEFCYAPQTNGRYEFRVKPLLNNRKIVTLVKPNDRKGLEERFSRVRAIDFSHDSPCEDEAVAKSKFYHHWEFRSSMFNWRCEGWEALCYQGKLPLAVDLFFVQLRRKKQKRRDYTEFRRYNHN